MALLVKVPGFLKTSPNLPYINSQHEGSVPGTLVLFPPPSAANTPLVSSNE